MLYKSLYIFNYIILFEWEFGIIVCIVKSKNFDKSQFRISELILIANKTIFIFITKLYLYAN